MFSVAATFDVTCVGCDAERELPEADGTPRMPATSPDGTTTLQVDTPCKCGAKRVRVKLRLD